MNEPEKYNFKYGEKINVKHLCVRNDWFVTSACLCITSGTCYCVFTCTHKYLEITKQNTFTH